MYAYDGLDRSLVRDRVDEFRDQVARRLAGSLSEEQFKPLRLMNGLYLQLHGYMLRVAIPYGVLSSAKLRALAHVARRWDRGYGHFTTRQNLQFHWVKLSETPDILAYLAEHDLHAIQTSGNCIRNTTTDPFAGAARDEADDPRVWCEVIRQWSTLHPEFSYLPRKFKIAVTASAKDRAAIKAHDIGLRLGRDAEGRLVFEVLVGGGLGRTPHIGALVKKDLPADRLLSFLTAILRVYNREGRRDNLYKARIKILVSELGLAAFAEKVEQEWAALDPTEIDILGTELARIRGQFALAKLDPRPAVSRGFEAARTREDFARFARNNIAPHKVQGYGIVTISLKGIGDTPGDCTADQMEAIADLAESYSQSEIRVTHAQNLVLPNVALDDALALFEGLRAIGLASANINLASDIIACPGLDYCALANARAIPIAQAIARRFEDPVFEEAVGELQVKISGCINACGHHHLGHIGILGVDKKGEEYYQLTLGGSGAEDAAIGAVLGPAVAAGDVADAVEALARRYLEVRQPEERFLDTVRRLGPTPFKAAVYEHADTV